MHLRQRMMVEILKSEIGLGERERVWGGETNSYAFDTATNVHVKPSLTRKTFSD